MNRSCEFCEWKTEKPILIGTIHVCNVDEKETKLDGYCPYFRFIKK
ncbi:hypothetical protein [Alkaliphilus sp. B6464]|nr:hypothetical protein [Alkaliphilus sp. B6464]QUH21095.1 hypothetical protein HYG84_15210 [Alkaliphilus sp. B6464]